MADDLIRIARDLVRAVRERRAGEECTHEPAPYMTVCRDCSAKYIQALRDEVTALRAWSAAGGDEEG